jgi:hypothetical protein
MTIKLYILSATTAFSIVIGTAASSPAEAAVISCTGSGNSGSIAAGYGANCGFLGVGDTFRIDVTSFFSRLGSASFNRTPIGIGVTSSGGTPVSFQNLSAVVTGIADGQRFTIDKPAIFGSAPYTPFGSAATPGFKYTTNGAPVYSFGSFKSVDFTFGTQGAGGFGSMNASPKEIGLTQIDEFLIVGSLASVGNKFTNNIVSFGVGPAGMPMRGSAFGGNFTTEVPGPLPIAGAGAAFAWSRKLRRKQKLAASGGALD